MICLQTSLAASLLLAMGCVASLEIPPATGSFEPGARDRMLTRAIDLLERRGYDLALVDRLDGVVVTRPKGKLARARLQVGFTRKVVQICLTDEGTAIVNIDGAALTAGGQWAPMTQGAAADALGREQRQLLGEIFTERHRPASP